MGILVAPIHWSGCEREISETVESPRRVLGPEYDLRGSCHHLQHGLLIEPVRHTKEVLLKVALGSNACTKKRNLATISSTYNKQQECDETAF